jgi:hypothetical protein
MKVSGVMETGETDKAGTSVTLKVITVTIISVTNRVGWNFVAVDNVALPQCRMTNCRIVTLMSHVRVSHSHKFQHKCHYCRIVIRL